MTRPSSPPASVGRRPVLSLGLGLALTAAARPARAVAALVPGLPPPSGPHAVGGVELYLVDASRPDPWDPAIPVRELMVTVLYPARRAAGPVLPQFPPGTAAVVGALAPLLHPGLPAAGVDWAATATHARAGAAALPGRRPVVLYSPGGADPRGLGTVLAEDLASHGYAVVAVDHPGDAAAVQFPAPSPSRDAVRTTVFRGDPRADPATWRTMIDTRVADLRFVLGALPDLPGLPRGLRLEPRGAAAYGHSAGATAAAELLHADRRVRAAVAFEGYLDRPGGELLPVAAEGVRRPLSLVGSGAFPEMEAAWSAAVARSRGHAGVRRLTGAAHWSFTDHAATAPQFEAAGLMTAAARAALVGDGARLVPLLRRHLRRALARR